MEEASAKKLVSVAVGGGPDGDTSVVEVLVHDKPHAALWRERPKLEHRITEEELWQAKGRLRKISVDTLDCALAGFEMPQAQCTITDLLGVNTG